MAQGKEEPEQKIKELMKSADYTIDNNKTIEEFYSRLDKIVQKTREKARE